MSGQLNILNLLINNDILSGWAGTNLPLPVHNLLI
jgi:hypothetical protein